MPNPPKSKSEHLKAGSYRKSRHDNTLDGIAKPIETMPEPPAYFDVRHRKEWEKCCNELLVLGVLATADADVIELYCTNRVSFVDAAKDVMKNGIILEDEEGGRYKNPALLVRQQAEKVILNIASVFGFTPRARMGIKTTTPQKDKQASILDFIKGGQNKKAV